MYYLAGLRIAKTLTAVFNEHSVQLDSGEKDIKFNRRVPTRLKNPEGPKGTQFSIDRPRVRVGMSLKRVITFVFFQYFPAMPIKRALQAPIEDVGLLIVPTTR